MLPMVKEIARTRQSNRATRAAHASITRRMTEMTAAREKATGTKAFSRLDGVFRFENVSFAYDKLNDKPALNDVTVRFEAGQMTALVGPSGAGKSTLIDLIPRLRRPDAGVLQLGGINIEEFAIDSLRAGISSAPQTPQIFNVSIAEHIRYGKPDASMEEVRHAAGLANAAKFIEQLPDGYETAACDCPVGNASGLIWPAHLSAWHRSCCSMSRPAIRMPIQKRFSARPCCVFAGKPTSR